MDQIGFAVDFQFGPPLVVLLIGAVFLLGAALLRGILQNRPPAPPDGKRPKTVAELRESWREPIEITENPPPVKQATEEPRYPPGRFIDPGKEPPRQA